MVDAAVERRERRKKTKAGTQASSHMASPSSAHNASSSARTSPAHLTTPASGRMSRGNVMRGPDWVMIDSYRDGDWVQRCKQGSRLAGRQGAPCTLSLTCAKQFSKLRSKTGPVEWTVLCVHTTLLEMPVPRTQLQGVNDPLLVRLTSRVA
jgi:hypothetical protein